MTATIINFPLTQSRALYAAPLAPRPALTSQGMPVRAGDRVGISYRASQHVGLVEKVGRENADAACQVYQVLCYCCGTRHVVTADQIEAP